MIMDIWPDPYINAIEVFRVLDSPVLAGPLHFDEDTNKKYVRSTVNRNSMPYKCGAVGDIQNGTKARARIIDSARLSGEGVPLDSPKAFKKLSKHYQHRKVDYAAIAAQVADMLREEDRI
jgi:hypothetical protein